MVTYCRQQAIYALNKSSKTGSNTDKAIEWLTDNTDDMLRSQSATTPSASQDSVTPKAAAAAAAVDAAKPRPGVGFLDRLGAAMGLDESGAVCAILFI